MSTTSPPTNKGLRFPAEPLTRTETARLLAAVPTRSTSGLRLRALIAVMYGAGLRVQEALDLMPRDVDGCTLRVRDGKGGKTMTVSIDPASCDLLGRWMDRRASLTWMDRRASLGLTGRHRVFTTYSANNFGQPLDSRYVRAALARHGEKAGIEKRVHPHGLRHSLAFQLYQDGVPLNEIRRQLRHSSLAGTQHYIDYLCPSTDLAAVMAARPDWTKPL
jgi:site-specific recombinase XerD